MGTYQFARLEIYPRQISSQSKEPSKRRTVNQIVNEVARKKQNCSHIDNPKAPIHLEGCPLNDISETLDKYLDNNPIEYRPKSTSTILTRKPKSDSFVLLAAVYSYPQPTQSCDIEQAMVFFRECLKFHKDRFGSVDSAVMHLDEPQPHIHVYSFSNNAKMLHPGHSAKKRGREKGLKDNEIKLLYRKAMSEWQDEFHQSVGQQFGMERTGPKRQRVDRQTHLKNKQIAESALFTQEEKIKNRKLKKQIDQDAQIIEAMKLNLQRLTEQLKNAGDLVLERERLSESYKSQLIDLETINEANQSKSAKLSDENSKLIRYVQSIDPSFNGDVSNIEDIDDLDDSIMRM